MARQVAEARRCSGESSPYRETTRGWVPWVAYPIASLVGWSRVQDDEHWASDVVAGAALGLWTARKTEEALRVHAQRYVELAGFDGLAARERVLQQRRGAGGTAIGAATADCEQGQDEQQQTAAQAGGHGSARVSKRP